MKFKHMASLILLALFGFFLWLAGDGNYRALSGQLKHLLLEDLVSLDSGPSSEKFDAAYIMGGDTHAQRFKFHVASEIYREGLCDRFLFMSVEGWSRYSAELARNYTNDELTVLNLERAGVDKSKLVPISIRKGPFGTMNEAKSVVDFVRKNHYRNVLVISAPYHSRRVRLSFRHFVGQDGPEIKILGSGESVRLRALIYEFLKLKFYGALMLFDA